MKMRVMVGVLVALLALLTGLTMVLGQGDDFSGTVPAPPFAEGLDWLNVPGPLTWEALRGKVVLLDFWTYGCINCIHIIPDLKRLEAEFADELVVIGVHSAKFENEGDTENIRQIIQRYEIEHPIVNDSEFAVWSTWGIRAWPTVMVIDPAGNVFSYISGEGIYGALQPVIQGMVAQFDAQGLINRDPIEMTPETEARPETLLAFPGKVLADAEGGRLFIADSNHNRIVVADLETYEVLAVIGGVEPGNQDGDYATARFYRPQGMALSENGTILYVADTENHTLRAVNLETQTVTTLAGTGRQARFSTNGGFGLDVALNSPWDLVRVDGVLYIAMAGPHQLWSYDIATGEIAVHSGSGREDIVDGAHAEAALAQPSGITTDGQRLYFADSEASAIRIADVDLAGGVETIVGTGLFDFGDRDGVADEVLLQHPLGVVYVDGLLYVADTYNSKIKVIDPATRQATSLTGDVVGGFRDGSLADALLDEPGGISYANGRLYVADTNNHAIRVIDLESGQVFSVVFPNREVLQADRESVVAAAPFTGDVVVLEPQHVAAGDGAITLNVMMPEGYKFNDIAPFTAAWQPAGQVVAIAPDDQVQRVVEPEMPLTIPVALREGSADLAVDLLIYYCESVNENFCFVERVRVSAPVVVSEEGDEVALLIEHTVSPPQETAPGF